MKFSLYQIFKLDNSIFSFLFVDPYCEPKNMSDQEPKQQRQKLVYQNASIENEDFKVFLSNINFAKFCNSHSLKN